MSIADMRKAVEDDDDAGSDHPFELPLALLNQFFVEPIERAVVSSVDRFISEKLVSDETGQALSPTWTRFTNTWTYWRFQQVFEQQKVAKDAKAQAAGTTAQGTAAAVTAAEQAGSQESRDDRLEKLGTRPPNLLQSESTTRRRDHGAMPFIYLRKLFREYELFCLENDLPIEKSRADMQRRLVKRFNLRVKQIEVCRLRGIVWTDETISAFVSKLQQDSARIHKLSRDLSCAVDLTPAAAAAAMAEVAQKDKELMPLPKNWLRMFLEESTRATKLPSDWIDLKTGREPPDGEWRPGLVHVLRTWCRERGFEPPDLVGRGWIQRLPPGVTFRDKLKVRQVYGVKWRTTPTTKGGWLSSFGLGGITGSEGLIAELAYPNVSCHLSASWYVIEAFAVMVHVLVFFGSAVVLALIGTYVSDVWSCTVAHPEHDTGLVLWQDIVQPVPLALNELDAVQGTPTIHFVALVHLRSAYIFATCAAVRMLFSYLNPTCFQPTVYLVLRETIVNLFAWVFTVYLLFWLALLCTMAAWMMLATVLQPERLLPYGTAVGVLIIASGSISNRLSKQYDRVHSQLRKAMIRGLTRKLERARHHIEQAAAERLTKDVQTARWEAQVGLDQGDEGFDTPLGPDKSETVVKENVTAQDIFALLLEARDAENDRTYGVDVVDANGVFDSEIDEDGEEDQSIDKSDFQRLFVALDLNLSSHDLYRLFNMTDLNGSGNVTSVEFEGAWESLVEEFITESMREVGLSPTAMVVTLLASVSLLVVLFSFIFLVLSSWSGTDEFDAIVQAVLIAISGSAAARTARIRNDENIDEGIATVLGNQEAEADGSDE